MKQLKKSCAGYFSYLTRISNHANKLIRDYSNKKQSSQHTVHKTKMSSKPSESTHPSCSTSLSVKSSLEKERSLLLATQGEKIYNQNLKQIEKEKRILELENEKEKELNKLIEVRHKVELAGVDFELENKSVTSYESQWQHNFLRRIHQKPAIRPGSDRSISKFPTKFVT